MNPQAVLTVPIMRQFLTDRGRKQKPAMRIQSSADEDLSSTPYPMRRTHRFSRTDALDVRPARW